MKKPYVLPNGFDDGDVQKNKVYAALAYLVFFIPLIACPKSRFARFHANQGLMLLAMLSLGATINLMLSYLLVTAPPQAYLMIGLVSLYVAFFCIAFFVLGVVNALTGKVKRLPLLGKLILIKWFGQPYAVSDK